MRRRLASFGLLAGVGLLALLGPRYGAVGQYYGATTSSGSATNLNPAPGERTTIFDTGGLFQPGALLSMNFFSHQNFLGTTTADSSGNYRVTIRIPDDATAGQHQIRVTGANRQGGTHTSTISVTVRAGALPDTGRDLAKNVRMAFLVLTLGELLIGAQLFMTRRRRLLHVR